MSTKPLTAFPKGMWFVAPVQPLTRVIHEGAEGGSFARGGTAVCCVVTVRRPLTAGRCMQAATRSWTLSKMASHLMALVESRAVLRIDGSRPRLFADLLQSSPDIVRQLTELLSKKLNRSVLILESEIGAFLNRRGWEQPK